MEHSRFWSLFGRCRVPIWAIVVSMAAQSTFEAPHIARLELYSIGTSFGTLWLGTFFWSVNNSFFAVVLSILIVSINVVFVMRLVQTMIGDTCRDYEVVSQVGTNSII